MMVLLILTGTQTFLYPQSPTVQAIIDQTNLDSLVYFVKELSGEVQTIIGGSPYTIVSRHKKHTIKISAVREEMFTECKPVQNIQTRNT